LPLANSLDLLATHDPDMDEENEETPVYEKFDPLLHREHSRNKRSSACFYYDVVWSWYNADRLFRRYNMMDNEILMVAHVRSMLSGGLLEAAYWGY